MVLTPSSMVPLGTKAPDFTLINVVTGKSVSLQECRGKMGTLVMFICNHCPYVKHVIDGLVTLAEECISQGVQVVAISSNDVEAYPEDGVDEMKALAKAKAFPFPYLFDETQEVAKLYRATCTPDFFLYDQNLQCVYRGQLDDSRPRNGIEVTGKDLREACQALIDGKEPLKEQKPSIGCNIKWR